MSGSNPFDFSEYQMGPGQGGGPPGSNDPFAQPSAPRPQPSGGGDPFGHQPAPPQQSRPGAGDPFAAAGGDPFASGASGADPFQRGPAPALSVPGAAGPGSLAVAGPPVVLLFIALGLAIVAGVVALLVNQPIVAIACWLVAGPIGIGLVAFYVRKDTYARSAGLYAAPGFVRPLYWITVIGCLIAIWAPAWRIADWVGHL